jgi:hypothetical protein
VVKSRRMKWVGHVIRREEMRNSYNRLVGKSEGKKPLGKSRLILENNIRIDLKKVGHKG